MASGPPWIVDSGRFAANERKHLNLCHPVVRATTIDIEHLSQHAWVAGVAARPVAVPQNYDRRMIPLVIQREPANVAYVRSDAGNRVAADLFPLRICGQFPMTHGDTARGTERNIGNKCFKDISVLTQSFEHRL